MTCRSAWRQVQTASLEFREGRGTGLVAANGRDRCVLRYGHDSHRPLSYVLITLYTLERYLRGSDGMMGMSAARVGPAMLADGLPGGWSRMSHHAVAAAKSSSYGHDQGGRRREEPGWPAGDEGS